MTDSPLRLRVFAGPNGSGKSTIIQAVRDYRINNIPVDFGIYINADDIARSLREGAFNFSQYEIEPDYTEFTETSLASGLINEAFTETEFLHSFSLDGSNLTLVEAAAGERIAQIAADYLRRRLLAERKKFSFETVFSHRSKIDFLQEAAQAGYKVYLYFVSTESPAVNMYRVDVRTRQGGHHVPSDKIESRYYRSLDLLFDAAQCTYQTFFFDNSTDRKQNESFEPFAHFKMIKGEKKWDPIDEAKVPDWFIKYYVQKIPTNP